MIDFVSVSIGVLSIIACAIAAWFAYKIKAYNRLSSGWMAVVWAFVLIVLRRGMGLVHEINMGIGMEDQLLLVQNMLQVIISLLFIWGFWSVLKSFECFEVTEKRCVAKLDEFNKKPKRK
jgi:hypothetical protein